MGPQEFMELIAKNIRHTVTELGRIGFNITKELPSATTMLLDSFFINDERRDTARAENPHVIFMPGFFALSKYYLRLCTYMHANGVYLITPQNLNRNVLGWKQSRDVISYAIKQDEDETGLPPILIGHSKGGTDILGTLPYHPEIQTAILISSPVRGASLRALNIYLSITSGKNEFPFDRGMLTDPTLLSKIVIAISTQDKIVPAHEAVLDGARHTINVEETANDDMWYSHTGLAYHIRKEILKVITEHTAQHVT